MASNQVNANFAQKIYNKPKLRKILVESRT